MRVTAADILEEIFGHSVDCLIGVSTNRDVVPVDIIQAMGRLALVPRWCAKVLRR